MAMKFEAKHLKEGYVCPYCGLENVEGNGVEIDGVDAMQEVNCTDCERQWFDHYKLVRVEEVEE